MSTSGTNPSQFLLLLFLSLILVRPLAKDVKCHPEDIKALLKIRDAFNETLYFWNPSCCSWPVECDLKTHRVTQLVLAQRNIPGRIPDAIGDLPYLERIMFHKLTNFSGPIPYSIAKLKRLKYLTISGVNLTGTIPDYLGQLKSLAYLSLSFNNLTGPIPSSLGQIPNLEYIGLDRNKLTGTIPASLFNLKRNNIYLILSHNQLSGQIPDSFRNLDFEEIDLSRNKLQGDISMLFGYNKTTEIMGFSRNMFEFNLSNIQIQQRLTNLDISHNKIYGSIPEAMTHLELMYLNVSYNRLCGQIPQGGHLQTRVDYSAYFHNRCLCGPPLNNTCK